MIRGSIRWVIWAGWLALLLLLLQGAGIKDLGHGEVSKPGQAEGVSDPSQTWEISGRRQGEELLGTAAAEWTVDHWINAPPLSLSSLKGKVVLVRWWTAPECPFCAASAPSLNELDRLYRDKGLAVIGLYHHKSPAPLDPASVTEFAKDFGFTFPVAIDWDWVTLKRWWLGGRERAWTSVSFLLDRDGVIRFIHPGGSYPIGSRDYEELRAKIEELL